MRSYIEITQRLEVITRQIDQIVEEIATSDFQIASARLDDLAKKLKILWTEKSTLQWVIGDQDPQEDNNEF